eukprot:8180231-Alexandrium_andersonii.AAC.1
MRRKNDAESNRVSGANSEGVPEPAQLKLRTPRAVSHVLGSQCSTTIGERPKHQLWGEVMVPLLMQQRRRRRLASL